MSGFVFSYSVRLLNEIGFLCHSSVVFFLFFLTLNLNQIFVIGLKAEQEFIIFRSFFFFFFKSVLLFVVVYFCDCIQLWLKHVVLGTYSSAVSAI